MHKMLEAKEATIVYPESDGEPMAENSIQFEWIVFLYGNLAALYRDNADVFVSGNQNWFPREGEPGLFKAPDVYVVFGRPKGHRTSWKQWQENDTPMTVVFEVLSPKNTWHEMADKLQFYDDHGVEEYYVYDPEANTLDAYQRGQATLRLVRFQGQYTSPRLGIRFDLTGPEMTVFYPDGRPFLTFAELEAARVQAEQRASDAEQRASDTEQRAENLQRRLDRQAELMRKVLAQQATPEETQELQHLLAQSPPGA